MVDWRRRVLGSLAHDKNPTMAVFVLVDGGGLILRQVIAETSMVS